MPMEMRISEGKRMYDIVGFQDTSNFAISEKLYTLLVQNGFTGWRHYDIRIAGTQQKYYGFQVTGRCGKLKEPQKPGFYLGYKFEYAGWDCKLP